MLNGLDLFSGIGGLTLALEPWVRPVAYCENDRHAQSVLLSRLREGRLPRAPIWDDVRTLSAGALPPVDIIYGGFPCQDISSAGNGCGLEGERSGLFFEIVRLARELRPRFVFLENVPAITFRGLDRVLLELTALGLDCRWTIVSAAEVGAPHLRERWFLLAHAQGGREGAVYARSRREGQGARHPHRHCDGLVEVPYAERNGLERAVDPLEGQGTSGERRRSSDSGRWAAEPDVGRVAHGVSHRVDRLRGLGNAVVPAQARVAFLRLLGQDLLDT
jgi:DNA (cytosine-5)-methyltransferase 1